jgi:predicted transcriptional regulator
MKRTSVYLKEDLFEKINELAVRESRSTNQIMVILLEQAIKERERQRNKKKRDK